MMFVSKKIAKKLKEKGFMRKCFGYYIPNEDTRLIYNYNPYRGGIYEDCLCSHNSLNEDVAGHELIDAPTIEQVLEWLRGEKNLFVTIEIANFGFIFSIISFEWHGRYLENEIESYNHDGFESYEEAALAGIECALDDLI